jgi:hypothetical protein
MSCYQPFNELNIHLEQDKIIIEFKQDGNLLARKLVKVKLFKGDIVTLTGMSGFVDMEINNANS